MNGGYWNVDGEITVHIGESLDTDDKIFRYMPYCRIQSFFDNGIYIPKVSSFAKEDPFEGEYTETFYSHLKMVYEIKEDGSKYHGNQLFREEVIKARSRVFANCWALSKSESIAMWKLYGKDKNSIAIQTTIQKLKISVERFLSQESSNLRMLKYLNKQILQIKYIDHHDPTDCKNVLELNNFDMLCHKNVGYRHEEEVRLLFDGSQQGREAIGESLGDYFFLKINPTNFVDKIVVCYLADQSFFDNIVALATKYNLANKVCWSRLKFVPGM